RISGGRATSKANKRWAFGGDTRAVDEEGRIGRARVIVEVAEDRHARFGCSAVADHGSIARIRAFEKISAAAIGRACAVEKCAVRRGCRTIEEDRAEAKITAFVDEDSVASATAFEEISDRGASTLPTLGVNGVARVRAIDKLDEPRSGWDRKVLRGS